MSVEGVISLLREKAPELVRAGLDALLLVADLSWPVIAHELPLLIQLADQDPFRPQAALLCASLHFHLKDHETALQFALQAGPLFQAERGSEFTDSIVRMCIGKFIAAHAAAYSGQRDTLDPKIKNLVNHVIRGALAREEYKLVLGVALEGCIMPLVEEVSTSMSPAALLQHVLPFQNSLKPGFRTQVLEFVAGLLQKGQSKEGDLLNMLVVYRALDRYEEVAKMVYECLKGGQREMAYTICLEASEMHGFAQKIMQSIPIEPEWEAEHRKLTALLEGRVSADLYSLFLVKNCNTDPHYLAKLKSVDTKVSTSHSAAILSISLMQAYTQDDSFLNTQENLDWVVGSSFWAKFNSIASLGLIHQMTRVRPLEVFKKYLPNPNADAPQPFVLGGALYGMGLLAAGSKNDEVTNYSFGVIDNPMLNSKEPVVHGACLCLGLTAFASGDTVVYEKLKNVLDTDTAVTGQAAALAIGLSMAGTNNEEVLAELIGIESEHDKINFAICQAIALISIGHPNPTLYNELLQNQTLKKAAPLHLASAYFATSNSWAVRQLLTLATDISNEIKRTAVVCLGFVLHGDPELASVLKMMASSYNPHIRFGLCVALAVGSTSELAESAADLLWPFFADPTDFVKQAALISTAMVCLSGGLSSSRIAEFRKVLDGILSKRHEYPLVKLGAILAMGLVDAGGRNMKLSLRSSSGYNSFSLAAMLIFTDFWHWYPYIMMVGLCLSPAVLIGVDREFRVPLSFGWKCQTRPSVFSYPPHITKEEAKEEAKKEIVELSTTKRVHTKALQRAGSSLDLERSQSQIEHKEEEVKPKERKDDQPSVYVMKNASRVLDRQTRFITWVENRYIPVVRQKRQGIIFLRDTQEGQAEEYLGVQKGAPVPQPLAAIEEEVPQPAEFTFE